MPHIAGNKAPDFTAETDSGKTISLKDYRGKWVVLYFYPKDNTSGCTKEACDFRDNMERITSLDVAVLGVSPDSAKSHGNFINKFNLNFTLLADSDKSLCKLYEVLGEKSLYGKKYIGVIRSTFIIDNKGYIREVFTNVKVDGHVEAVMTKLYELKK